MREPTGSVRIVAPVSEQQLHDIREFVIAKRRTLAAATRLFEAACQSAAVRRKITVAQPFQLLGAQALYHGAGQYPAKRQ